MCTCVVVSRRPGGVFWRAHTKACGAMGEYSFSSIAGDEVARSTLTVLVGRGELLNCLGALSFVIWCLHSKCLRFFLIIQ